MYLVPKFTVQQCNSNVWVGMITSVEPGSVASCWGDEVTKAKIHVIAFCGGGGGVFVLVQLRNAPKQKDFWEPRITTTGGAKCQGKVTSDYACKRVTGTHNFVMARAPKCDRHEWVHLNLMNGALTYPGASCLIQRSSLCIIAIFIKLCNFFFLNRITWNSEWSYPDINDFVLHLRCIACNYNVSL